MDRVVYLRRILPLALRALAWAAASQGEVFAAWRLAGVADALPGTAEDDLGARLLEAEEAIRSSRAPRLNFARAWALGAVCQQCRASAEATVSLSARISGWPEPVAWWPEEVGRGE